MNKITLIADNGGGFTLQVTNAYTRYQHYYNYVTDQTAVGVLAALDGDTTLDWEGNDANEWLNPSYDDIQNGGYNVIEADCYHTVLEWGVDSSWANVTRLTDLFDNLINKEG